MLTSLEHVRHLEREAARLAAEIEAARRGLTAREGDMAAALAAGEDDGAIRRHLAKDRDTLAVLESRRRATVAAVPLALRDAADAARQEVADTVAGMRPDAEHEAGRIAAALAELADARARLDGIHRAADGLIAEYCRAYDKRARAAAGLPPQGRPADTGTEWTRRAARAAAVALEGREARVFAREAGEVANA